MDLLGGERDLRRPHRIRNVALLRHADDGERPLADRPRNGNLSDADAVFVREEFQRQVERLDLVHDGVVDRCARGVIGHRMMRVVLTRERALLEHHVGEEMHVIRAAIVQNARLFRRAVQQAVVVLHRAELQPVFAQDAVCLFDLVDVVVRDADHRRICLALEELCRRRDPARRVHGVVHPVDIHVLDAEQF